MNKFLSVHRLTALAFPGPRAPRRRSIRLPHAGSRPDFCPMVGTHTYHRTLGYLVWPSSPSTNRLGRSAFMGGYRDRRTGTLRANAHYPRRPAPPFNRCHPQRLGSRFNPVTFPPPSSLGRRPNGHHVLRRTLGHVTNQKHDGGPRTGGAHTPQRMPTPRSTITARITLLSTLSPSGRLEIPPYFRPLRPVAGASRLGTASQGRLTLRRDGPLPSGVGAFQRTFPAPRRVGAKMPGTLANLGSRGQVERWFTDG